MKLKEKIYKWLVGPQKLKPTHIKEMQKDIYDEIHGNEKINKKSYKEFLKELKGETTEKFRQ